MDVSVIIVNYNTKSLLKDCLNSILEKTVGIAFEVIVVDNASTDGSQQIVKKIFPEVILIENNENLGFGRANNIGAKVSRGRFLFFLNSDTILIENSIKIFLDFYENYLEKSMIGAIGCKLIDNNGNNCNSYGKFPTVWGILKFRFKKLLEILFTKNDLKSKEIIYGSFFNVDYISGADLFIPHFIFKKLNGFSDDFFLYYEETDLQKRMETLNLMRIVICPTKIIHMENGTVNTEKSILHDKRMMLAE